MKGAGNMEINAATSIANQEISGNKAQVGLDVLTRTIAKTDQVEQAKGSQPESLGFEIAQHTGKGQNIDIKA